MSSYHDGELTCPDGRRASCELGFPSAATFTGSWSLHQRALSDSALRTLRNSPAMPQNSIREFT